MRLCWVSIIFAALLIACRSPAAENAGTQKSVAVSANNALSQTNSVNQSSPIAVKTGRGIGSVTKINLEIGSVELKHEEIKGMMPAMQMEFYVSEKKELEPLKIGDHVTFTLEDNQGAERIISISKTE